MRMQFVNYASTQNCEFHSKSVGVIQNVDGNVDLFHCQVYVGPRGMA